MHRSQSALLFGRVAGSARAVGPIPRSGRNGRCKRSCGAHQVMRQGVPQQHRAHLVHAAHEELAQAAVAGLGVFTILFLFLVAIAMRRVGFREAGGRR